MLWLPYTQFCINFLKLHILKLIMIITIEVTRNIFIILQRAYVCVFLLVQPKSGLLQSSIISLFLSYITLTSVANKPYDLRK